jgi:hypothetical protein
MSKKRVKQYLMLLTAIGLVSIAAGGSGTFASFDAEVTNSGNYFATGTLVLNDNGGTNTCTSAVDSDNHNTTGTDCDTLFTTPKLVAPSATTSVDFPTSATFPFTLTFQSALAGASIDNGDTLTLTNSNGQTTTVTATEVAQVGTATSVTVTGSAPSHDFPVGSSVSDNDATYFADLTLTNAGSIDSSGIEFETTGGSTCTTAAQEPNGTLSAQIAPSDGADTEIPVASVSGGVPGSFADGDPLVVSHGSDAQTFIVDGAQTADEIATHQYILVQPQTPNATYPIGSTVAGPSFTGAASLCGDLKMSIEQMTSNTFTSPVQCSYPTSGATCTFDNGTALTGTPSSFQPLALHTTTFGHGDTDYFLIALKIDNLSSLGNAYQNKATSAFGLTWQLNQA